MKINLFLLFIMLAGTGLLVSTCNKTDNYTTDKPADYMNLKTGKYILYKLDSQVFTNYNQTLTNISYQAKDVIDSAITDNSGRPSWRVIRYLRDSASTSEADWKPNITYMITVLPNSVEVVEENQRYIKLKLPVTEGYTWKGNAYIDPESFDPSFSIGDWDYKYSDINSPFTFDGKTISNTITVNQRDEVLGNPLNPFTYTIRNFGKEVYAKNTGLIYKELFHSEYQTFYNTYNCYFVKCNNNVCDTIICPLNDYGCESDNLAKGYKKYCKDTVLVQSYYIGYGIKLRMIDHN